MEGRNPEYVILAEGLFEQVAFVSKLDLQLRMRALGRLHNRVENSAFSTSSPLQSMRISPCTAKGASAQGARGSVPEGVGAR